jgi:hypothetical protein
MLGPVQAGRLGRQLARIRVLEMHLKGVLSIIAIRLLARVLEKVLELVLVGRLGHLVLRLVQISVLGLHLKGVLAAIAMRLLAQQQVQGQHLKLVRVEHRGQRARISVLELYLKE